MQPTVYQKPEIRDANDNIIQQGAFGKNTALANSTNDGWIDYVANDLEFLYDLAKDEVVPVPSLPASGQTNKTYLLTTTGVSYRWSGTEWVAVSSSEAVGRAETAANLAEQWATKTDGTVDGTEYSAKYYAEQAEASADDAQDVADDMATHLVQIDKNTGGVAKNSKRISNIEKLLQGNLYDYDTDDDIAYVKDVPSGALPYAGIEQIGGKTLVWNQLVNSGATTVATISGHKYYTLINGTANIVTSSGSAITIVDDTADMVFDLTLMFGSGNEPSTVAEFEAMFPAQYYPYNAGTLLSAGVTEVKSVGKNLADYSDGRGYPSSTATSSSTKRKFTIGKYVLGMDASNNYNNVGSSASVDASGISVTKLTGSNYGCLIPFNCKGGETYTASAVTQVTGASAKMGFAWYAEDGSYISNASSSTTIPRTAKAPVDAVQGVLLLAVSANDIPCKFSNIQIEVGSTATAYSPYIETTMPIPAEVRALEGYGWSAGTAYNYIDFERKVFVKCVDRVDLGTLTYTDNGVQNNSEEFICANNAIPDRAFSQNLVCAKFVNLVGLDTISINTMRGRTNSNRITFYWTLGETASNFKSYVDGVYLYYELATPIETDISAYLTDNLIEVGAGGTLTFPNSNGNDYHIPVPSTETYMIDLQEAISNG